MLLALHALNLAARPNGLLIQRPTLPLSGDGAPLYIMQRVLIALTQVAPPALGTTRRDRRTSYQLGLMAPRPVSPLIFSQRLDTASSNIPNPCMVITTPKTTALLRDVNMIIFPTSEISLDARGTPRPFSPKTLRSSPRSNLKPENSC